MKKERSIIWVIVIIGIIIVIFYVTSSSSSNTTSQAPSLLSGSPASGSLSYNPSTPSTAPTLHTTGAFKPLCDFVVPYGSKIVGC